MGKVFFTFDGSIGCMIYRNYATFASTDFIFKGITVGISLVPGIEIKVTQNFALNFNLGLNIGSLSKVEVISNGKTEIIDLNDMRESVSRIDLSLGLRWYK